MPDGKKIAETLREVREQGNWADENGYVRRMREVAPDICWRMLTPNTACMQERGHQDGIHEPGMTLDEYEARRSMAPNSPVSRA